MMRFKDFARLDGIESVDEFTSGAGDVSITPTSLEISRVLHCGLRLRANSSNSGIVYVGQAGVSVENGFSLPPGDEIFLSVNDPSLVYVVSAAPGDRYSWIGQ